MQRITTEMQREIYCPRIRFKRARSSGSVWVTEALFPCYVFAKLNYYEHIRHLKSLSGVRGVISFAGVPATISPDIIATLKEGFSSEEIVEIQPGIEVGSEIRIVSGPYKGIQTLVTKVLPARQRVAILLEILGNEREVEIDVNSVLLNKIHPLAES